MLFTYHNSKMDLKKAMILGGVGSASLLVLSAMIGGRSEAKVVPQAITVEPSIQKIANQALSDGVKKAKAEDGFAIVTDPMSGTILALSYYDGSTQQSIEVNKAADLILSKVYAPQSLVKPIIVASALDRKKVSAY